MKTKMITRVLLVSIAFAVLPRTFAQDGTWAVGAPFPFGRMQASGTSLNGIIYSIGGRNLGCGVYSDVDAYDPATNTWTSRAPLLRAVSEPVVGVINGKIYAATGSQCGSVESATQVYDPASNSWTLKAPNPQARSGAGGGVIDGNLYVVGGNPGDGTDLSRMDVYDPITDTWTARAPMPTPRSEFGSAIVNGILYTIGGMADPNGPSKVVEAYDPKTDQWTSKAPLPEFRYWSPGMATALNGLIYVCGGARNIGSTVDDGAIPSDSVFVYDPAFDTWTSVTSMPLPHAIDAAVESAGNIYVFAGYSSFTPDTLTTEVNVFTPARASVTTPVGSNVTTAIPLTGATISISFPEVTAGGTTSIGRIDPSSAGSLPSSYSLLPNSVAFDITTGAVYATPLLLAFQVPSLDATIFSQLRVLHYENGTPVDVTASTPAPDPVTQTIYAQVSSLSPFVLANFMPVQAQAQPPINADGTSVFAANRGSIPVKFTVTQNGAATCNLPTATIGVTRTAGGNPGGVNESVYLMPSDSGSTFRNTGCQYAYNLNASRLGVGTYRVDIKINNQVVGAARFKLK